MIAAVATSTVFLGCYLVYHYLAGSTSFRGQGSDSACLFHDSYSHTILATLGVVPLVVLTLFRAIQGDFIRHARIAKVTFPIWLYVSITGVVIYLMLYQMPVAESMAGGPVYARGRRRRATIWKFLNLSPGCIRDGPPASSRWPRPPSCSVWPSLPSSAIQGLPFHRPCDRSEAGKTRSSLLRFRREPGTVCAWTSCRCELRVVQSMSSQGQS